MGIAPIALAFAVLDLTGSVSDLGFVLAARTVPQVAFLLAGGVGADRIPRQRLMMLSDLGRFTTQTAVAGLLLTGSAQIWELMVLQAVNGAATAFFYPAATALTPQIVSRERLQQANALLSLASSALEIIGPIIADDDGDEGRPRSDPPRVGPPLLGRERQEAYRPGSLPLPTYPSLAENEGLVAVD